MNKTPNLKMTKNEMPTQSARQRIHNFSEVELGYDEMSAIDEAKRCLDCVNFPCVSGCPVRVNIPKFIEKVRELDFEGAYEIISQTSNLPAICGRVCTQETQCEAKCVRGIKGEPVGIGRLERFVADYHNRNAELKEIKTMKKTGHKVAVIGSGPSGLTCAGDLAKMGHSVTIFEALHKAGGVLVYGIPEFRLPKKIVEREIENLTKMGVEIKTNVVVGKTVLIDELFDDGYEAVFIGSGAGLPKFMGINGEHLNGVYSANEYLTRCNLMKAYEENSTTPIMKGGIVAVVGGGNVAIDVARTALRLGAKKVHLIYRRSFDELPARKEEVNHAKEEGVEFNILTNPVEIIGYKNEDDKKDPKNGFVKSLKCIKMELREPDERGRRRPIEIENSEFEMQVDTVVMAIGTSPNPLIKMTTSEIETNKYGGIIVEELTGKTTKENVYAGGDAVTGAATVISAMGAGKLSAKAINDYLSKK
ncbi:MAG: NADPH-dependent glutamate synthase [Clostridia bacterium]|nr:NADPH-dependent glutamate synthase [Clostridia bacterium]